MGKNADGSSGGITNGAFYLTSNPGWDWESKNGNNSSSMLHFEASRVVPTAEENRPINKAVRYFIKAK